MLKLFDVMVPGYGTVTLYGRSAGGAKAKAWRSDAFWHLSFMDFLKMGVRAKLRTVPPEPDGYDYIRNAYGVDVSIGQKVTLQNEGADWNGKVGEVMYPGPSTASVHVLMEGYDRPIIVHPSNVVPERSS